jgi:hypothetical protein
MVVHRRPIKLQLLCMKMSVISLRNIRGIFAVPLGKSSEDHRPKVKMMRDPLIAGVPMS